MLTLPILSEPGISRLELQSSSLLGSITGSIIRESLKANYIHMYLKFPVELRFNLIAKRRTEINQLSIWQQKKGPTASTRPAVSINNV